jgi:hypothetical protein
MSISCITRRRISIARSGLVPLSGRTLERDDVECTNKDLVLKCLKNISLHFCRHTEEDHEGFHTEKLATGSETEPKATK